MKRAAGGAVALLALFVVVWEAAGRLAASERNTGDDYQ